MDLKFLPCPFCGACEEKYNELYVERDTFDRFYVVCDCCYAEGPHCEKTEDNDGEAEAIEAWNDRVK
tara:strand:- start:1659 stop:1859 length:201 start_codon:yes stop_codon:yes gene_type:complete